MDQFWPQDNSMNNYRMVSYDIFENPLLLRHSETLPRKSNTMQHRVGWRIVDDCKVWYMEMKMMKMKKKKKKMKKKKKNMKVKVK